MRDYEEGEGTNRDTYDATMSSPDVTGIQGDTGNSEDDTEAKTEEIKANIEQTRNDMSHTIDAIQEKLNPQNIVDQAKESVREATIGRVENMVSNAGYTAKEAGNSFMDTIKENPLQAAIAGLSLGWLFMKSRSGSSNKSRYGYENIRGNYTHQGPGYGTGYDYNYNYETGNRGGYNYQDQGLSQNRSGYRTGGQEQGGVGEKVGEKVGEVAGQVGQKAGDVVGAVGDAASQVRYKAGDVVEGVGERAGDLASQAQYMAQRGQGQFQRMLWDNPLAVGAAAVVAGAAIGLLVPETEQENKIMGEARDNLMYKAKDAAGEAMDKVKNVAGDVGETVKQAAGDVQQTAKEAAQREGITQS